MKITGTREAFYKLVSIPAINKELGVSRGTISIWKAAMEGTSDRMPTLDKMEEMLIRYGAKVVKEKVWEVPDAQIPE